MAVIASSFWASTSLRLRSNNKLGNLSSQERCGLSLVKCCNKEEEEEEEEWIEGRNRNVRKRREILVSSVTAFSIGLGLPFVSNASSQDIINTTDVAEGFGEYRDEENKFTINIPKGWRVGVGEGEPKGFKSVTAFYPQETTSSNVSVIITGLGPDFTKIESFGKVDEFAETLVSGLDRSWQRPAGVTAKLISSKSKNGFYYIDYWLENPGESRKYLYSALGMASNGWYNRLYTITGQFDQGDLDKYGSAIQKVVASFKFTQ